MRPRVWVPAVVVVLGVAVVVGEVVRHWQAELPNPAPNTAAGSITRDQLERAARERVFFAHMSVGWNVLSGIDELYPAKGLAAPAMVQVGVGDTPPATTKGVGVIIHTEIGVNGDPLGKLANFAAMMRGGMAAKVDVAVLKFCFTDITAATDVEAVFAAYSTTIDELRREFPAVRILAATVPLEIAPSGVRATLKAWLRGDPNVARERFNALVRGRYGADERFDVAAAESTEPDGQVLASLYPAYSSDGSHLNDTGSAVAAVSFLTAIART